MLNTEFSLHYNAVKKNFLLHYIAKKSIEIYFLGLFGLL